MIPDLHNQPVLLYVPTGPMLTMIEAAARAVGIRTYRVEHIIDLIVEPTYLCIVDPIFCTHAQWQELTNCVVEMSRPYPKYLLTTPSPYPERFPDDNGMQQPTTLTKADLQSLLLQSIPK